MVVAAAELVRNRADVQSTYVFADILLRHEKLRAKVFLADKSMINDRDRTNSSKDKILGNLICERGYCDQ